MNGLVSYPGLFAKGALDKATELLITHLPDVSAGADVLDYACGIKGMIARHIEKANLTLIDYDPAGVAGRRQNVPGAVYLRRYQPEKTIRPNMILSSATRPYMKGSFIVPRVVGEMLAEMPRLLKRHGAAYLVTQVTVPVARVWRLNRNWRLPKSLPVMVSE